MNTRESPCSRWQFTWHAYPSNYIEVLARLYAENKIKFVVCQEEVTPTTDLNHLQGYLETTDRYRKSTIVTAGLIPVHWTRVGGSADDRAKSINYCKKQESRREGCEPTIIGSIPSKQGARNDYAAYTVDAKSGITWPDLQDKYPELTGSKEKWSLSCFSRHRPKPAPNPEFIPQPWHELVNDAIANPDNRKIHFVVDIYGNLGKSWLCDYLACTRDDVQLLSPGKLDSMQYLLEEDKTIFLLDCPRSRQLVHIPYDLLEGIKDGRMVSTKYVPCKKFPARPNTVVVFMNEVPDIDRVSHGRLSIWYRRQNASKVDIGWSQATPHPQCHQKIAHKGKLVIPPPSFLVPDGVDIPPTVYARNHVVETDVKKRLREEVQDEIRRIDLIVKREKLEDRDRTDNVGRIPDDNRFGLYGGIELTS